MRTTVKSIRLPHSLADQIAREAEKRNCTLADVTRDALSEYFERRQAEAMLLGLEQRINTRIDAQTRHLDDGLKKILSLAVPA